MTVLDSSGVVDYLTDTGVAAEVRELLVDDVQVPLAAPEIIVVEVVSTLRRLARRKVTSAARAGKAVEDLGAMRVDLFPTIHLRRRAWDLRDNVATPDAMFLALAELLDEPLATKDGRLARAASQLTDVKAVLLGS
ncbi:hypothetical protein BH20ACT15_BH20ACT15_13440 [soil metagenome]